MPQSAGSPTPSCGRPWSTTRRAARSSCSSAATCAGSRWCRSSAPARRASGRSSPTTSSTDSPASSGNPVCFGKTYNLSGAEPITLRALGKLMLELEGGASGRSCTCRCRCAGRSPPRSARVMKNPPLTPYAVAGFTNDADLDCGEAMPTSAIAPRGVRAGLARCSQQGARHDGTSKSTPRARAGAAFTPAARWPRSAPSRSRRGARRVRHRGGGSPSGSEEKPDERVQQLMAEVGGKAKGIVVWSSSRVGNHDLFVMNTDGSNVHPITHGDDGRLVPALLARRQHASCSAAARRAGCSSATRTPTASGTSTR